MTPELASGSDSPPRLNPVAMSVADAARLLTGAGGVRLTEGQIQADIDAGSPTNADGTISLVFYAVWLVRETANGGTPHGD